MRRLLFSRLLRAAESGFTTSLNRSGPSSENGQAERLWAPTYSQCYGGATTPTNQVATLLPDSPQ